MIVRNKRISMTAREVQLSLSFGVADIKSMIRWVFYCYRYSGCEWLVRESLERPFTEQYLIEIFQNDPRCFGNFEQKWGRQLAQWAFNSSLREKFIIQSATHENLYFFTEKCITKKRGRPMKE